MTYPLWVNEQPELEAGFNAGLDGLELRSLAIEVTRSRIK